MPQSVESKIVEFQKKITSWYKVNKRDLPWRRTSDPYHILVSEMMLQQTQVSRVIPKYRAWLEEYPSLQSLADADISRVLRLWMGLGYNRRAIYLQKTAQVVVSQYKGVFPEKEKALLTLPGIGKYTARALLSFAFGKHIPVVDTNIKKVILVAVLHQDTAPDKNIEEWAARLLPKEHSISARDWNQALMDYASLELKDKKIIIPKQSKFRGSDRYYRGQVLRLLLAQKDCRLSHALLLKKFQGKETAWLTALLAGLEKDGLVHYDGKQIYLTKKVD